MDFNDNPTVIQIITVWAKRVSPIVKGWAICANDREKAMETAEQ